MYRNELVSRKKTGDKQIFLIFRGGVKAEGRVHRCVLTRKSIPSWLMVSRQAGTGSRGHIYCLDVATLLLGEVGQCWPPSLESNWLKRTFQKLRFSPSPPLFLFLSYSEAFFVLRGMERSRFVKVFSPFFFLFFHFVSFYSIEAGKSLNRSALEWYLVDGKEILNFWRYGKMRRIMR